MTVDTKKIGEQVTVTVPLIGGAARPPQHIDPEFVDCRGLEAGWGIKRSFAYALLADGKIEGVSLRRGDQVRGKRLFSLESVRAYLNSKLENEQSAAAEKSGNSLGTLRTRMLHP
jgi:hypothetical protein